MPRTKALSPGQRQTVRNRAGDQMVGEVLAAYKSRTGATDEDLAKLLDWDRGRIKRLRKEPGQVRLADVRRALQRLDVTPEQWLTIGGLSCDP